VIRNLDEISKLDTRLVEAIRDLCPKKRGESCSMTAGGRTVVLTKASRLLCEYELERRYEVEQSKRKAG